jgi:Cellulase (glycosyl hydrolase family 5)
VTGPERRSAAAPARAGERRFRGRARAWAVVLACLIAGPALLAATVPPDGMTTSVLPSAAVLVPDPGSTVADPEPGHPEPGVTVDGDRLLRDGEPWVPRGFNMIGLLTPAWCDRAVGIAAREHFGPEELAAAREWGADVLRFQVSQRGLADPAVAEHDRAAYRAAVLDGVAQARAAGFAVVVSMQDQFFGCGDVHPLPSTATMDAWSVLVPSLRQDPGVLLELFNEPRNEDDAAGWRQWRAGGSSPDANLGDAAVGHQALVDHVRELGSTNVLVADTARLGERSAGLPLLDDPLDRLAYGVHPYYYVLGRKWWDEHYGDLAAVAPVVATEWNHLADECGTDAERLAPDLLDYLTTHDIGVFGHAFDIPGTTVADWSWTPTDCGTPSGGSGALLRDHFRALARAPR